MKAARMLNRTSPRAGTALLAAACALILCAGCAGSPASPTLSSATLIPANSVWKYLDDGSDQGTQWRQPDFDDSFWSSGRAPLGNVPEGDRRVVTTSIKSGPFGDHVITYYFRHAFTVSNPAAFQTGTLRMRRDDGAIVFINGTEVARSNMPSGPITYQTPVPQRVADEGMTWWEFRVPPAVLAAGRNLIAVELHEYDYTTDAIFDAELLADAGTAPGGLR